VESQANAESIIIGADTAVVDGTEVLGKPADESEAARFLKQLRGHVHQVYTGIAALRTSDSKLLTDMCVTDVPMRDYSDAEIDAYVRTGDPLDKAGAYAIQHPEFKPVGRMRGCYPSVMGLPLCRLVRLLEQLGLPPASDITSECHEHLDDPCPVYAAITRGDAAGPHKGEE
jgi:MAF protein